MDGAEDLNIQETFQRLHKRGQGALIAFITGGDPSPKYTPKIAQALIDGGADILELGVPFSDPIADGPIIQSADYRALNAGTTPQTIFDIVKSTKKKCNTPIALLTYYNILYKMGIRVFLEKATRYGVDGLIIPDLPIEEAGKYKQIADKQGIDTIFLVSPLTSVKRLTEIRTFTTGFLYLVSVCGVTGTRNQIAKLTTQTIHKVHPYTVGSIPLAVGFGISQPAHVKTIIGCGAEGAIVGSAFVKIIEDNLEKPTKLITEVSTLAEKLKAATYRKALI